MNLVKIWHNPKCSKSREALSILENSTCKSEIINYLEVTPTSNEIKDTLKMIGISPRELMRTKEDIYKELNLADETNEEKLVEAMRLNPILIERPVLFKNNRAIIGRPSSIIEDFLNS